MNDLNSKVKALASELGFDDCRIALAKRATHADQFEAWIENGSHGDMQWMERNPNRRCDPREVLQGCKAVRFPIIIQKIIVSPNMLGMMTTTT